MLMDATGKVVGQSSYIRHKKTTIIPKTTSITQPDPLGMRTPTEIEQVEPIIREIPPIISENDIHQAMMILYDSVRK